MSFVSSVATACMGDRGEGTFRNGLAELPQRHVEYGCEVRWQGRFGFNEKEPRKFPRGIARTRADGNRRSEPCPAEWAVRPLRLKAASGSFLKQSRAHRGIIVFTGSSWPRKHTAARNEHARTTCGSRFYDLARDPINCPICGAAYTIIVEPASAIRRPNRKFEHAQKAPPPIEAVKEADEEIATVEVDDTISSTMKKMAMCPASLTTQPRKKLRPRPRANPDRRHERVWRRL